MSRTQATLALVGVFLLMGLMGRMDYEDAKAEEANYCEMVKLHKQDKSMGWPDYDGIYAQSCKP